MFWQCFLFVKSNVCVLADWQLLAWLDTLITRHAQEDMVDFPPQRARWVLKKIHNRLTVTSWCLLSSSPSSCPYLLSCCSSAQCLYNVMSHAICIPAWDFVKEDKSGYSQGVSEHDLGSESGQVCQSLVPNHCPLRSEACSGFPHVNIKVHLCCRALI